MPTIRSLALLFTLGAAASPTLPQSLSTPVRLVTGDQYPPLTGSALPGGGLATEIVVAAFEILEIDVEIEFAPWKRGYESTRAGRYSGTFPYIKTEGRHRDFYYSKPLLEIESLIFVSADSELNRREEIEGRSDLIECVPLGFPKDDEVLSPSEPNEEATVTPADMTSCFTMILHGRADYFAIGGMLGWATVRALGIPTGDLRTLEGSSETFSQHLIVPRLQPEAEQLIERFNEGLARLRASGEIDRLVAKHTLSSRDPT